MPNHPDETFAPPEPPPHRLVGVVGTIEDWLGIFFATLLVLLFGFSILPFTQMDWSVEGWPGRTISLAICIICGIGWLFLDAPYLWRLVVVAHHRQKPFAFQAAIRQRYRPAFLRPLIGLWWMAHFAGGIFFAAGTQALIGPHHTMGDGIFTFFLVGCYGYAANGFLILAACAFTSSDHLRWRIWRLRAVTDLCLALISVGFWHW